MGGVFFLKRLKVNLIIFLVKRMPHGEVHAMTIFHGSNVQNILVDQRVVNLFLVSHSFDRPKCSSISLVSHSFDRPK
jgi:hypothetical protein